MNLIKNITLEAIKFIGTGLGISVLIMVCTIGTVM